MKKTKYTICGEIVSLKIFIQKWQILVLISSNILKHVNLSFTNNPSHNNNFENEKSND